MNRPSGLYSIWHLNLMYSSIEESQRQQVIERCFWPLLDLGEKGFRVGIEAPGHTLEIAEALDRDWIRSLRDLCRDGKIEIVGSGYSQLISPLVPAAVNSANLREGIEVYQRLLEVSPRIWMFNEQAFSEGLIEIYLDHGVETVVLDWSSAYGAHPEWERSAAFRPAWLGDGRGSRVKALWSDSIGFQKFQRHVHREIRQSEYWEYLDEIRGRMQEAGEAVFCFYGNDAEIFDFRPGRFATEPAMSQESEWKTIVDTLTEMRANGFEFLLPSEAAAREPSTEILRVARLSSPISVKKQPKYNVTRWALTGRGSPEVNQACFDLFHRQGAKPGEEAKALCEFWSSDYRTHITENRWKDFTSRLAGVRSEEGSADLQADPDLEWAEVPPQEQITVEDSVLHVELNPLRGLSIERCGRPEEAALVGRIRHGTFSRMDLSADWYTGNLVLQLPGRHQQTDLRRVSVRKADSDSARWYSTQFNFSGGSVRKTYGFSKSAPSWTLEYRFNIADLPTGSLRFGYLTFLDLHQRKEAMLLRTHCGGRSPEEFAWEDVDFDHGEQVTSLVSANQAFGMTENTLEIETGGEVLSIEIERSTFRVLPLLENKIAKEGRMVRLYFSGAEYDETRKGSWSLEEAMVRFRFTLEARERRTP